MTLWEDYVSITVGTAALVVSFFGENFYYARGLYGGGTGKAAPKWAGKLMFAVVGLVFLLTGFYNLFRQ